jgi:hypothetical protein
MVNRVNSRFGYSASWTPSAGGPTQNCTVLFKDPTREMELSGVEYMPLSILMEYNVLDFVGLRDAANAHLPESVTVDGIVYNVRQVNAKYDGKTFIAVLEEI